MIKLVPYKAGSAMTVYAPIKAFRTSAGVDKATSGDMDCVGSISNFELQELKSRPTAIVIYSDLCKFFIT